MNTTFQMCIRDRYKVYAVEIYGHDMVILLADENIRVRDKLMRVEDELEAHDFLPCNLQIVLCMAFSNKRQRSAYKGFCDIMLIIGHVYNRQL